jgi:hypothetical protein
MLIQQVIISYVDLQWSNYRTMIATGVLFALMSRLSMFATRGVESTDKPAPQIAAARLAADFIALPSQGHV